MGVRFAYNLKIHKNREYILLEYETNTSTKFNINVLGSPLRTTTTNITISIEYTMHGFSRIRAKL